MKKSKILQWIHTEFEPLTLAVQDTTLDQIIDNALRFLNVNSAFRNVAMVAISPGTQKIQIPTSFKMVVKVYPSEAPTNILANYPSWSLLGIAVLDNNVSDLILTAESFKSYRSYLGADFRWTFEKSSDPLIGGYLYVSNFPSNNSAACVVGTKRFILDDVDNDLTDEAHLDILLRYIKALVKKAEGNLLRKADIISVKNDGQELYNEGKEEAEAIEEEIRLSSRWVSFAQRF